MVREYFNILQLFKVKNGFSSSFNESSAPLFPKMEFFLRFTDIQGKQAYHWFNYNVVMRERFSLIKDVIDLGYNILLHDADIFWVSSKIRLQI